jgi:DNA helicase II / ATP-dependent DNA helicase PcrA
MNPGSNAPSRDADRIIEGCLALANPTSFFLYAGAGSGKTRSLVNALQWIREHNREAMWTQGRRVAVITYTNAATDEIKRRIEFDPFIEVSTIHSFAWSLVSGFDRDIRLWLKDNLAREIAELLVQQQNGRAGTKAATEREHSIKSKAERLAGLDRIRKFIYSPSGDNRGRDALNHAEVIGLTSALLRSKAVLQQILVNRYPTLLVDESQDTNRHLVDALLDVQLNHASRFCLGFFGDTMQRIFPDGKVNLAASIPQSWAKPEKMVNYRCPTRVLRLINQIRKQADGQEQTAPQDADIGFVRLFLAPAGSTEKARIEATALRRMAEITNDPAVKTSTKTLILEHHMAASRMGFSSLFEPLYAADRLRTGLLEGKLPALKFITDVILPLSKALKTEDSFRVAAIVRSNSPLLDKARLRTSEDQLEELKKAKEGAAALRRLFDAEDDPTLKKVLQKVEDVNLFELPSVLKSVLKGDAAPPETEGEDEPENRRDELSAWTRAVDVPFSQVAQYDLYITDKSLFGTHQGVKGLEFPHVAVLIDDEEARGFSFSYEKLFALKAATAADLKNAATGNETSVDRTRRLFYVTCSRAEKSLSIVAYASDRTRLRQFVIERGWFEANEIEDLST